jgi:lysine-ketoglutarate reductase/saccharopine dehydrogenase-like protein (TIGR00300 family)
MEIRMRREVVIVEGHIVDSGIMSEILDTVIKSEAQFKIISFEIGKTNLDPSCAKIEVSGDTDRVSELLPRLNVLGCYLDSPKEVTIREAESDRVVPDDFYSTTNHTTNVFIGGKWIEVHDQRMDAVIVIEDNRPVCRKLRDVRQGDEIVCGVEGIKVMPVFRDRDRSDFAFMSSEISSERRVELAVQRVAEIISPSDVRTAVVAGPVVVHTGASQALCSLIEPGHVNVLLSGNALAVHDIEQSLYGTSLGIHLDNGMPVNDGHRNHIRAINAIYRAGSIENAVKQGVLKSGIMYTCVKRGVPFVLAGSIRDDGPLPEVITDMNEAQQKYAEALSEVDVVLMLSTMLHSIAVGNMLPSSAKTIIVDINPSVVTKLSDRGSSQAVGIVTDVGLFLHLLSQTLRSNKPDIEAMPHVSRHFLHKKSNP